jgi:peptidoglycan/xylan/chitin deacetylase (PgdA/CDA1 family)
MFWACTNLCKKLFPRVIWKVATPDKKIYLTFDDGPTPGITPLVLAFLKQYNAKATFFVLGAQVEQYPQLTAQIQNEGHLIANHGYRHIDGFYSSTTYYINNAEQGALISESSLFRPPFGRITPWQLYRLKKKHQIVLWSCMSMDFSSKYKPEQCLSKTLKSIQPGAIIVFHDTEKASDNLLKILPKLLNKLQINNYQTETLETLK